MAMNESYKPKTVALATAAATVVPLIKATTQLSKWDLLLLGGIAKNTAGAVISNGAVLVWMNTASAGSVSDADFITFTNGYGRYGVTITTGQKFAVRFYS